MDDVKVIDATEASRYEVLVDGEVAGHADYRLGRGFIVFTHTEVYPSFSGRGLGTALARAALDDVRARGDLRVVPRCPFIRSFIEENPEYQDLLART